MRIIDQISIKIYLRHKYSAWKNLTFYDLRGWVGLLNGFFISYLIITMKGYASLFHINVPLNRRWNQGEDK